MLRVLIVIIIFYFCTSITHAEDGLPIPLKIIAEDLLKVPLIKEKSIEVEIDESSKTIILQWKTRKYKIYDIQANGEWETELVEITGPLRHGCRFEVCITKGEYGGALSRNKVPVLSIKDAVRQPYYYASYSVFNLKNANAQVNIYFGRTSDKALIMNLYNEILKAASKEIGPSN